MAHKDVRLGQVKDVLITLADSYRGTDAVFEPIARDLERLASLIPVKWAIVDSKTGAVIFHVKRAWLALAVSWAVERFEYISE